MANNMAMNAVYNQFSTTYMPKPTGRYDTHKRTELRSLCDSMAKVNRDAPLYKFDRGEGSKHFLIHLKEEARELRNTIASTMGNTDSNTFNNKIAYSSDINIVGAKYIGEPAQNRLGGSADSEGYAVISENGEVPSYEIEVTSLASPQVNLGKFLANKDQELSVGEYSFDISINDMEYEFQFNVNEGDTHLDLQKRLMRLINNSKIGLNASIEEANDNTSALRIESTRVGIDFGQSSRVFKITNDNANKNSDIVDFLGLDYVAREASNAHFLVNGAEASATSNNFILQNTYEITLNGLSENEGQTVTIGLKPDTEAFQENISTLVGSYNNFIRSMAEYKETQENSANLISEMNQIAGFYYQEMEKLGISLEKDGSLAIDDEKLGHALVTNEPEETLSSLKAFSRSMLHKSNQISLNPVTYLNKKVVAYKNPANTFIQPYVTSAYSGMFFNNYC